MALNAYDVQVCLWKMIKLSTKTCVNVSKKHPYVTSCLLFLFLLYMWCPLIFWILIYSLPLAVSTWVVLSIRDSRRCKEEREIEREQKERESGGKLDKQTKFTTTNSNGHGEEEEKGKEKKIKKAYSRVHSVRRRRAKEIACGDDRAEESNSRDQPDHDTEEDDVEEEENAVLSTDSNTDTVDKTTLAEESPKEIREVEVDFSLTNTQIGIDVAIDHQTYRNSQVAMSLKLLKDDEDIRDEASKAMDVNIAEADRNKRLESLIARRRSQKMLDLRVKKPLVNTDATMGAQMPPIIIPKISTWCSPSKAAGPNSPGPGSAPSALVPMRNPFDLPYDPQEEKPDLTGDSFQQEFATGHNRDFMFCRHESFSLGPSLPMDFFDDRDDLSSLDGFGFRRRRSSIGYHFPKSGNEESDADFGATTEAESGQESESKSNMNSPNSDQIKEVIQVHESHSAEGCVGPAQPNTRHNPLDELSLSSNSSSGSTGSSEDERPPICKINREAILKSLSMRRNSVSIPDIEMESNEQLQENNLSYANSALENASRLKQQYFADKPQKRHGMTFSIASDMQVEVSELSSPPLTIGENMSYQDDVSVYDGEMERNTSWDGLDSWAGSSRMSEVEDNETRRTRANEVGASRSKKCDDANLSGSTDEEKHCITSSSSASEISESHATDVQEKIPQTTSPESNTGEEQPASASEDAKSSEEIVENNVSDAPMQRVEGEHSNQVAMDSNDPPQERSTEATISPKSVLQPTLSVASFDHEGDDEVQLSGAHRATDRSSSNVPQNSASLVVHFTVGTSSNGAVEASQESSGPPNASYTLGAKDTETSNEQQKIQENDKKLKEVAGGSSSKMVEILEEPAQTRDESTSSRSLTSNVEQNTIDSANDKQKIQENDEAPAETREESSSRNVISNEEAGNNEYVDEKLKIQENETNSRTLNNGDGISREDFEAANQTTLNNQILDNSISSLSNENEMAIQESAHNDSTKTSSYEGKIGKEEEEVGSEAGVVEDKDKYASHERNEADEEARQRIDLHDGEAK